MSTPREALTPALVPVNHCRVCGSTRVLQTTCRKHYYLINLDTVVPLTYKICQDCQFIFQGEYVGDAFLNAYYEASPMLRRPEPTEFEVDQNRRQARFLAAHADLRAKRVVEIGAHAGAFLRHLHAEYGCEAYFDELSQEARAVLDSHPGLHDLRAVPGTTMDIVVLRHILEHIFDLDGFLKYVRSLITEDGRLFVEVPDWSRLDQHTDPLIFEHLNQFNTSNLLQLMRRTGWQCDALEKSIEPDDPATPNRVQRFVFRPANIPPLGDPGIASAFEGFLLRHYEAANVALNALVDTLRPNQRVALYPASHLTFTALLETRLGEANLVGMFDIDAKKHGKVVRGQIVRPASDLATVKPDLILLFTMAYEREIRESFARMGVTCPVVSITDLLKGD